MSALGPLEVERRCSLFISSVFAVVGFSVGLNSLVKANQERSLINQLVAPHGIIDIGIHDVFTTGAVITTICALLAMLSGVLCALTWQPIKHQVFSFRLQSWTLFVCAAWLCATLVVYDYFFATRSAQMTINLLGQRIPEPVMQRLADLLGFTYAYRDVSYLRLLAVLPWFAFILAVIAGTVLRVAASRADAFALNDEQKGERDNVES